MAANECPGNVYSTSSSAPYTLRLNESTLPLSLTIAQSPSEHTWPGGALWDPAVVISKLFEQAASIQTATHPSIRLLGNFQLRNTTIIEMGCGVGLTSIALGALGARFTAATDMPIIVSNITTPNITANAPLYSTIVAKGTRSRVVPLPLLWGSDDEDAQITQIFNSITSQTNQTRVDLIIAADIAYNRPGEPSHFDDFMRSLNKLISISESAEIEPKKTTTKKKTKKKNPTPPPPSLPPPSPLFVYCHRRRMVQSEDLLHLIYDEFIDKFPPITALDVDPKKQKTNPKAKNITIHFLSKKRSPPTQKSSTNNNNPPRS